MLTEIKERKMPTENWEKPAARAATVRVSPLIHVRTVLRELGCEPEPVIRMAGLSPAHFEEPENEISYVTASRLLALCEAKTGCQNFGLLLAEQAGSSSLGVAGFMLRFAPDVGTALRALKRNLELHDQGGMLTLAVDEKFAMLGYAIHQPDAQGIDQIYDMSVAMAYKVMRELCGAEWKPTKILLSRRPPKDTAPYRQFFRAPVQFRSAQNAVIFPASWLAHVPNETDPMLYRYFEQEADELRARNATDTIGKLRRCLLASLFDDKLRVEYIAHQLGMHERTMHRRLKEEGTSFRRQLEDIRYMMARRLLADPANRVAEIAAALRYADATAFCRAFKRWSGCTPSQWRRDTDPTRCTLDIG